MYLSQFKEGRSIQGIFQGMGSGASLCAHDRITLPFSFESYRMVMPVEVA